MKKRKKKEDILIMISAGILLAIIAMSGIYIKISNAPEKEFELKGKIGELYTETPGNQPPSVGMINPNFIEAYPQTEFNLSASYSDPDGISDLAYARLIIDKNISNYPNYTARIDYFPNTNKITIYDKEEAGEKGNLVAQYSFEENIG